MSINLPNLLTLTRVAIIPLLVCLSYIEFAWSHYLVAVLFIFAGVTDWLDGYFARKLKQTTNFGIFLDPVADKLIVCTCLVLIVERYASIWLTVPAIFIIAREIFISALREWMAELGHRDLVAVGIVGKLKTFVQMLAIALFLSQPKQVVWPQIMNIAYVLLYVATILTMYSMLLYWLAASKYFKLK